MGQWTGSRDGAVVEHSPPTNVARVRFPRPGVICGLSLLLVLVLAEGFSPGSPVFLPPQKSTSLNSNSIWKQWMKSHSVEMPKQILFIIIIIMIIIDSTGKELGERRIPES